MRFALLGITCLALGQDFSDIQIEKASSGHRFTESPLWSRAAKALLFCDIPSNQILAFLPDKGTAKYRENMAGPSALAYDPDGRLVVAQSRTRRIIRLYPGEETKFDVLAERFEGKRLNAPNDLAIRKDGQLYFTDPAFGAQSDTRELDFHGVYHLSPKGELSLIAKPKGRPNGITLSPNGRILYVANSDERKVYAYDLDGRGRATGERVFLDNINGPPDGLRTDEKGNLYVAANHIYIVSPQAQPLHTITMGDKPSSMNFGDEDRMTLYITAKSGVYRARMKVKGVAVEP
jgi:gluconolactonase